MQKRTRAASAEVEFGKWWVLEGARWRVAWLEDTGELYAAEPGSDRFLVLGHFARRDIQQRMRTWFNGDDLAALIRHLKQNRAN